MGRHFPGCMPMGIYAQVCVCAHTHRPPHQSTTWRPVFQTYKLLSLTHSRCSINASSVDFLVVLALLLCSSVSGGFKANEIALVFLVNLLSESQALRDKKYFARKLNIP